MKLYSWNMLYLNAELDRAFLFIQKLDFDVLCLQEVPERFLERLKTLPLQLVYVSELDFVDDRTKHNYSVILSKHPVTNKNDFALPEYFQPFRTRAFVRFMQPWGWRLVTNRKSVFADIEMPNAGMVRVLCLHLTLSHPRQREREFDAALTLSEGPLPTIVCGDLNILASPRVTLLNWLLGGRMRDVVAWRSERRNIEKRFAELKLQNPLRGKSTQTVSHSQLDHILVPDTFRITRAEVIADRHGSDHHPVFVDCL